MSTRTLISKVAFIVAAVLCLLALLALAALGFEKTVLLAVFLLALGWAVA